MAQQPWLITIVSWENKRQLRDNLRGGPQDFNSLKTYIRFHPVLGGSHLFSQSFREWPTFFCFFVYFLLISYFNVCKPPLKVMLWLGFHISEMKVQWSTKPTLSICMKSLYGIAKVARMMMNISTTAKWTCGYLIGYKGHCSYSNLEMYEDQIWQVYNQRVALIISICILHSERDLTSMGLPGRKILYWFL